MKRIIFTFLAIGFFIPTIFAGVWECYTHYEQQVLKTYQEFDRADAKKYHYLRKLRFYQNSKLPWKKLTQHKKKVSKLTL